MLAKKNFAKSSLGAAITNTATLLSVATGDGVKFPQSGNFMAVIWGASYTSPLDDPAREIVLMTLSSGDAFTITRAQEGTAANAWNANDHILHTITAGTFKEYPGIPSIVQKSGSNAGNYITANTSWIAVDATNLSYTVTVPVGQKLSIEASGSVWSASAGTNGELAILQDGSPLVKYFEGNAYASTFNLKYVFTGDGNSHTFALGFAASSASYTFTMANSGGFYPLMIFRVEDAS
ncbi:MAG: hypothetical protein M0Z75_12070 [Nitrospiraceae bacterium]|nr:hypothetical protein [Nitrospiraceae bacterium]